MKKLFNRDFSRSDKDYIFSFNAYIMYEQLDPQEDYADMKQYDGCVVYPYDADSALFGLGELCGHIIWPQWCYLDSQTSGRPKSRLFYSRRPGRQQRRNRCPRPQRSTATTL